MPATLEKLSQDVATVQADFAALGARVVAELKAQRAELDKHGKSTLETGKNLDKLDEAWQRLAEDQKGIAEQVEEIKLGGARRSVGGQSAEQTIKSFASQFVESEAYKAWLPTGLKTMPQSVELKGSVHSALYQPGQQIPDEIRSEITSDPTSAGALVDAFRWQQVVMNPLRPRRLPDLIPTINVSNNAVEYPREKIALALVAFNTSEAASGQKNIVLGTKTVAGKTLSRARGFFIGQVVTVARGTANVEVHTLADVDHDTGTIVTTNNLANTHAEGTQIDADDFVYVPETNIKPSSKVEYELKTAAIKTLATHMTITRQMAEDSALLRGMLEQRMRHFLELSKERQILFGDSNESDQIAGILSDPDIQTYSWSDGIPGDTKLDALRRAFTAVYLSFFPVDAFVVHPSDWEDIELLKGSDGQYVFGSIATSNGIPRVFRATPVETPVIGQGRALAGSFRLGAVLWDRQRVTMRIAEQHEDYVVRNMLLMLLEERMALSVLRPTAFVDITLDSQPA